MPHNQNNREHRTSCFGQSNYISIWCFLYGPGADQDRSVNRPSCIGSTSQAEKGICTVKDLGKVHTKFAFHSPITTADVAKHKKV